MSNARAYPSRSWQVLHGHVFNSSMLGLLILRALVHGLIAAYYVVKKPSAAGRFFALHDSLLDLAGITLHGHPPPLTAGAILSDDA